VADPSRNFTATITVVAKRKDNKEGKELIKEQVENPKLIRDSVEKIRDKVRDTKVTDLPRGLGGAPSGVEADEEASGGPGRRSATTATAGSLGRAFIKPEERPSVGEPQRRVRKPKSRNTKRIPKSGSTG
jgi:hypothetical protein